MSRADAGADLTLVAIDVPEDVRASHTRHGQYCRVVTSGEDAFFALASAPGAPRWELLVKRAGSASALLIDAPLPVEVDVGPALGDGFPVELADTKPLVVVVSGSAISAVRSLVAARAASRSATRAYIGVRDVRDPPVVRELRAWADAGVDVTLCSDTATPETRAALPVRVGYAQRVCVEDLPTIAQDAVIFAAGHEEVMLELEAARGERPLGSNV